MDTLVQTIITQLPNLGVAVWMLWQQQGTIKALLDKQGELIDRLLNYVDADKERAESVILRAQTAKSSTRLPIQSRAPDHGDGDL